MRGSGLRLLRLAHVPLCVACAWLVASWNRPRPSHPPAPPPGATRWLWFDRSLRFERWHPAVVVVGTYAGVGPTERDNEIFASGQNVADGVSSTPNGSLLVRSYDFYQFNGWPAAGLALAISFVAGVWEWRLRKQATRTAGRCPACGYDLRATPKEGGALLSRCPECGAVPATGKGAV